MTRNMALLLVSGLLLCSGALAQTDIVGTWQGKIAMRPNETLTIQFIITKQANGSYAATVNSADAGGIKNIAATLVKFVQTKLTIEVPSLSGSYSGTLAKGVLTGEWKQQGTNLPLVLKPYNPTSFLKPLVGEWVGEFTPLGGPKMTTVFRFDISKNGKFSSVLDLPEQGQMNIPISDVLLDGNQVSFVIASGQGLYKGTLAANNINGTVNTGAHQAPLNLIRGKYEFPGMDMPAEDMKRLLGEWTGKFTPDRTYLVIWRFEKTKDGKLKATAASPEQGPEVFPITNVSLKGDQLSLRIQMTGSQYTGKLTNDTLTGIFRSENGSQLPVTLTKGGLHTQADVPAEAPKRLLGRWVGTMSAKFTFTLRFEIDKAGQLMAYFDTDTGYKNIVVTEVSLKNGQLILKIPVTGGSVFIGKLSGNTLSGTWKQPGAEKEISFSRKI